MFSGIVQALSKKVKFKEKDYGYKISVTVPANFTKKLKKGDSVAVNGVCLTVVNFKKDLIEFDVVHESIKLTNISEKFSSIPFNLERSLKVGDEVGGHFVSGHVHNISEIISFEKKEERILKIKLPSNLKGYIFKKGYVSINGISLTVVNVTNNFFTISIIPETISKTNLSFLKKGDFVNVEADQQTISIVETVKKLT
ncbi:MAG: riboflavin synthase subunit alpha [SAR86 cluster bacterium]|uniref:Riboflavin synthase n=1 Tax=SAR86 cluster bacterium TaxID=2030880 RepID=A0A937I244_9GAMM|nr:riboflavin synthase subunit alpha [SAR86 cluster bacterium]|tara:strand:+ start:7382 stop:7975 length:594 start_codon:yes stop_codon:yes gene_type:complete